MKRKKYPKIICTICGKSLDINDIGYEDTYWNTVTCTDCCDDQRIDEQERIDEHDGEQS